MKPRIIVCGLGRTGLKVFLLLRQQGAHVVGIHNQPIVGEHHTDIVIGDPQSATTLLAAGIRDAQTLVLTDGEDGVNLAVLMQARVLNPKVRIINRLFNTSLGDRLDQTLPDHISMSVAALSAPTFAFAALGSEAIGQLQLAGQTWPMHEEYISPTHPWCGKPLGELWDDRDRMLIYYLPVQGQQDLVSAILHKRLLAPGDRLIIGTKPDIQTERPSLVPKLAKLVMGLRYLQHHSRALLGGVLLLLTTIVLTTLVYVSSRLQTSPVDALYFAVGIITGAGGDSIRVDQAPVSLKLFTIFIMLAGAAIIGLSYALLNDFVLGTRFDHVWAIAQLPQRKHFVVCGLGGIGVQIVSHLRRFGREVVVIEQNPNARFLNTLKALKVPVIQGDARLPTTLRSANFETCQAILAVTSDDTSNLEIALNARGIEAKVPVVVRYQDGDFAHMAQQVFEFEAVLSPSELVAPAFAAAALGGKVLGNGLTANSLWVALATLITQRHPFAGLRVQEAAMASDFVPLFIETASHTIHGWELLYATLNPGDVLYLTMPAHRLDQLWRSTALPLRRSPTEV